MYRKPLFLFGISLLFEECTANTAQQNFKVWVLREVLLYYVDLKFILKL